MSDKPNTFVALLPPELHEKLKNDLIVQGFELTHPEHTHFSAKKKGISLTLYHSGKLVVQGKEMEPFIEFYLEPELLGTFTRTYDTLNLNLTAHIGIDESGKGDFFGPLAVAGVYGEEPQILQLKKLGIKDSKKINDKTILALAPKIREICPHHLIKINPLKYNEIYDQFKNLNRLLAWGHATAIEQLVEKTGCRDVIIDQFADEQVVIQALKRKSLEVNLTQRHRAEEDLVVAAASILARDLFLRGLAGLSSEFEMTFPKGASALTIEAGRTFIKRFGKELLPRVCKMHFKTRAELD